MKAFVYGSLKSGYWNNTLLQHSTCLGEAIAYGYDLYSLGGFPAVKHGGQDRGVLGEVYEIDGTTLQRLDRLEGNGSFYQREEIIVSLNGSEQAVWIYVLLGDLSRSKRDVTESDIDTAVVVQEWNTDRREVA